MKYNIEEYIVQNLGIEKENMNDFISDNNKDIKNIEEYLINKNIPLNNDNIIINEEDYVYNKDLKLNILFKSGKLSVAQLLN